MLLRLVAVGVVVTLIATGTALACKGRSVLFEDRFAEADPGWSSDKLTIENGRAELKPDAGFANWVFYGGSLFEDADMCVSVVTPEHREASATTGGLVFWAQDHSNFYLLAIDGAGSAAVSRRQNGRWLNPVSWRRAEMVKGGAGAINQLRIVAKGNQVTAYINDQRFIVFRGHPPQAGGQVGIYAGSENNAQNGWQFTGMVVTSVP